MTDPLPEAAAARAVTIDAAGLRLHLRVWGNPDRPPVILLHGGKDHGRSWDWTVAALLDRYCLVVPDLRGHGDSGHATGGHYADAAYLSDLALVDAWIAERWDTQPVLIGHSLGGNVALRFASAFPERMAGVVAIEGLGVSQARYDEIMRVPLAERVRTSVSRRAALMRAEPRRFADPGEAVNRLAALNPRLSRERSRHLAIHALRRDGGGWRWKHDRMLASRDPQPTAPAEYLAMFAAIACPVLLMYGTESWAENPEADGRLRAFANARLVTFDHAGHWLHHERFAAFADEVARFIGEVVRR